MKPAIVFEYDKMSDTLLNFGNSAYLKLIVSLSSKTQDGQKRNPIEQYRYPSNKYVNTSHLISLKRNFNPYLVIEYPNVDANEYSSIKTKQIMIGMYSIMGLLDIMIDFDKKIEQAFGYKKNKLYLLNDCITPVKSYPSSGNVIEFVQDIFYSGPNKDVPNLGVKMTLNNEYTIVMNAFTTWKSFLYLIHTSDLYGWGSNLVAGLTAKAIGDIIDLDPSVDDTIQNMYNRNDNVSSGSNRTIGEKISKSKPLNKGETNKSFFDK